MSREGGEISYRKYYHLLCPGTRQMSSAALIMSPH